MRKLLSFLAGIAVVGSSLLGAVGCKGNGLFGKDEKKSLTGTTAAKIALARERLDESVFSEEMSFWETQESVVAVKSNEIAKSGVTRLSAKRAKSRAVAEGNASQRRNRDCAKRLRGRERKGALAYVWEQFENDGKLPKRI